MLPLLRAIPPVGPVAPIGLIRNERPVRLAGLVAPSPAIATITVFFAIALILLIASRPLPRWHDVGRWNDARAAQIASPHADVATSVLADRALTHPRDE
jgi:hypothetical protein